jgi:hypothetical protein
MRHVGRNSQDDVIAATISVARELLSSVMSCEFELIQQSGKFQPNRVVANTKREETGTLFDE